MALALLLTSAAWAPQPALPALSYRYASFSVPEPDTTAAFLARYTGGRILARSEFLAYADDKANVLLAGVRLPYGTAYSDVYFRWDGAAVGADAARRFSAALQAQHTFAQDDWDWWQDWHLAFRVADTHIDAVATRLLKDSVPFVNRGSLYFMLPGGLTVQVLGHATVYWTEPFLFCRKTDDATTGRMRPYATNVTDVGALPLTPLPEFLPSHQSFATSDAAANEKWALSRLALSRLDLANTTRAGGSHAFADGHTCADIRWMETDTDGWEIHFIQQFAKRDGGLGVREHERAVGALRPPGSKLDDAFSGTRTGFSVSSVAPYVAAFKAAGQPYVASSTNRLLIAAPSGQLFELFEEGSANGGEERFDAGAARQALRRPCSPDERDVAC